MSILIQLGVTIGSILLMLAVWLAVQALVRRDLPKSQAEQDVLACRGCASHSCGGCSLKPE